MYNLCRSIAHCCSLNSENTVAYRKRERDQLSGLTPIFLVVIILVCFSTFFGLADLSNEFFTSPAEYSHSPSSRVKVDNSLRISGSLSWKSTDCSLAVNSTWAVC